MRIVRSPASSTMSETIARTSGKQVRERSVADGITGGARIAGGDVGDAVMLNSVDDVAGVAQRGGAAGGNTTTLVNGQVNDDGTLPHLFDIFFADEDGGALTGH